MRAGSGNVGILVTALVTAAALLSGCEAREGGKELVILCGSSFRPPMEKLCALFREKTGIGATTTVGGSEDLLPQVQAARHGDIFITHDPYLDAVRKAKALADHAHMGFVAPVLAVHKGNPRKLERIEDLARPDLKVALSDPRYSTCGEMVSGLLEKKGIKDAVMRNVENRLTKGHGELGNLLKTKAVDAVVMWNGVANTFKDSLDIVKTPYEYDEEIRVHVIGLGYSDHPDWVRQFIDLAKTEGRKIFSEHGYVK